MSTSASSSPSLHPTRRQLDELDALMERMLEVPVKAAEEEPQGAANPRALSPESSAESSLVADFTSTGFESYRTDEGDSSLADSPSAFDFHSPSPVHDNSVSPPTEPHGQTPFVIQSATSSAIPGSLAGSRESSPSSVIDDPPAPIWLWPVVGVNRTYDGFMTRLGSPGRMLLGRGRTWLGWIGLLMLTAALVWGILDWIHWAE